MELRIRNSEDLQSEIVRLTVLHQEQKIALGARFSSPSAVFSTITTIFPGDGTSGGSFFNQDLITMLSRIVLPMALNKTLFKHSNFIIKALVGLVSQKASGLINEDSVGGIWDKAKGLIGNLISKKKGAPKSAAADYNAQVNYDRTVSQL